MLYAKPRTTFHCKSEWCNYHTTHIFISLPEFVDRSIAESYARACREKYPALLRETRYYKRIQQSFLCVCVCVEFQHDHLRRPPCSAIAHHSSMCIYDERRRDDGIHKRYSTHTAHKCVACVFLQVCVCVPCTHRVWWWPFGVYIWMCVYGYVCNGRVCCLGLCELHWDGSHAATAAAISRSRAHAQFMWESLLNGVCFCWVSVSKGVHTRWCGT